MKKNYYAKREIYRVMNWFVVRPGEKQEGAFFDDNDKFKYLEHYFRMYFGLKNTVEWMKIAVKQALDSSQKDKEKAVERATDGDYIKVPMTLVKHIWKMRMPQTPNWRETGEIHYNKAIEDVLELITPEKLESLKAKENK